MPKLALFSLLFTTGCSVFGIRTSEELRYQVREADGPFEVREYAPFVAAQATLSGERDEVQNPLFRILAGYIFGQNQKKEKIAMTAPVVMDPQQSKGESIAMTAPVTMESGKLNTWTMSFSMPSGYNMDNLPQPLDKRVQLVEQSAKVYAVIRYSGSFNNFDKREQKLKELQAWLEKKSNYKASGEPLYAGYDPPFTLPFFRRNEVWIELTRSQP